MLQPVLPFTNEEIAMRHGLRRLDPISFKQPINSNITTAPPQMLEVELWRLCVNDEYQRDISVTGANRIRTMAENWDWEKYTPISIVLADQAVLDDCETTIYEVIDGQHEAIAAATNGSIAKLPAILKSASTLKEKADSFIGINKRVAIPTYHKFNTELAAGDHVAIGINCALSFSGCTLLEMPPTNSKYQIGDTLALAAMKIIVKAQGEDTLTRILRIAKAGDAAPVSSHMLKALSIVVKSPDDFIDEKISNYMKTFGAKRIEMEARTVCPPGMQVSQYMAETFFNKLLICKPTHKPRSYKQKDKVSA